MNGPRFTVERVTDPAPDLLLALERLDREAMGGAAAGRYTLRAIADHGRLYVARLDGEMAACAQYLLAPGPPAAAHLFGFFTAAPFRGAGVGRRLLAATLADLEAGGIRSCDLTVDPANAPAIRLYEACGFRLARRSPGHYGPGEERLVLARAPRPAEVTP